VYRLLPLCYVYMEVRIGFSESEGLLICFFFNSLVLESRDQRLEYRSFIIYSSFSIGTTTLVGFRPAQLSLSILSRKVLQSAVVSGTSNPQIGGESGI
jgi:hypothetical protein